MIKSFICAESKKVFSYNLIFYDGFSAIIKSVICRNRFKADYRLYFRPTVIVIINNIIYVTDY